MNTFNTTFVLAITALLAAPSQAQMTLNASRNPVPGDRVIRMLADTTGVHQGASGANRTWDFSGVIAIGESTKVTYVSPETTPAAADFPDATVATEYTDGGDSAYSYYFTAGTHIALLGMATLDVNVVYNNAEVLMTYPFSFGSTFSDISTASFDIEDGIHVRREGTVNATADGDGTILLPDNVSLPALRVKTVQTQSDTTYINNIPLFVTTMQITTYQWYTEVSKFPVFGISYVQVNTNGNISHTKSVAMIPMTETVDVKEPGRNIPATFSLAQNYPNPFNPSTVIRYSIPSETRVTLDVYNMIGQKVAVLVSDEIQSAGDHEAEFTAKNLPSGVYLYRLKAGSQVELRKLTIMK